MGPPSPPLLTQAQREQFTRFPPLDERILSRYYLLSEDDLHLIRERRRDFNKLGYAVQLTVLGHLGRALRSGETPPEAVLASLAEQLRVDPACYVQYATRDPTWHEHFATLCHRFGYMELSRRLNHELRDWLMPLAVVTDQPFRLMSALVDELRRRRVLVPRFSVLERLVQAARVRADQHTYGLLNLPLKGELPGNVDALLAPQADEPVSRFAWLGRPVGAPKAKHVLALLDRLAFVRTFHVQSNLRAFLPQSRLEHLAEEARRLSASHLGDFEPQRRRATLMAYLFDLSETLTDAVLDMHDRVMVSLLRDGEREAAEVFGEQGPPLVEQFGTFRSVCAAVIAAREQGADPYQAIEAVVNWQQLVETVREREVVHAEQLNPLHRTLKGYAKVRSYAPRMLATFTFQAEGTAAPLVEALGLLREMYATNKRTLPEHVPIGFVRQKWAGQVFRDGEIDRRAYELCVLNELRLATRAGDVWVTGSRKYKDLDAYLLPQDVWQRRLPELLPSLPETFDAFWAAPRTRS